MDNGYAPGTFVQYIDIVCKVATVMCPDSVEELEALRVLYSSINNDKENDDRRWRYKDGLLAKYANVTYAVMLRKIINQAESELAESNYPRAQDNRIRIILICLMLSVNAPMRGDYRNIVIKNRMETVPPKTPFYDDGWIYTPPGSRLKDSNGLKDSPTKIDMRGAQELIELVSRATTLSTFLASLTIPRPSPDCSGNKRNAPWGWKPDWGLDSSEPNTRSKTMM